MFYSLKWIWYWVKNSIIDSVNLVIKLKIMFLYIKLGKKNMSILNIPSFGLKMLSNKILNLVSVLKITLHEHFCFWGLPLEENSVNYLICNMHQISHKKVYQNFHVKIFIQKLMCQVSCISKMTQLLFFYSKIRHSEAKCQALDRD